MIYKKLLLLLVCCKLCGVYVDFIDHKPGLCSISAIPGPTNPVVRYRYEKPWCYPRYSSQGIDQVSNSEKLIHSGIVIKNSCYNSEDYNSEDHDPEYNDDCNADCSEYIIDSAINLLPDKKCYLQIYDGFGWCFYVGFLPDELKRPTAHPTEKADKSNKICPHTSKQLLIKAK